MSDVVLRHPKLPGQPIVVPVPEGTELSPEYERAGWKVAKTDPESIPTLPTVDNPAPAKTKKEN